VDANDQFGGGAKKVRVDDKDRDATGDDLADLRVGEVEAKAGRLRAGTQRNTVPAPCDSRPRLLGPWPCDPRSHVGGVRGVRVSDPTLRWTGPVSRVCHDYADLAWRALGPPPLTGAPPKSPRMGAPLLGIGQRKACSESIAVIAIGVVSFRSATRRGT